MVREQSLAVAERGGPCVDEQEAGCLQVSRLARRLERRERHARAIGGRDVRRGVEVSLHGQIALRRRARGATPDRRATASPVAPTARRRAGSIRSDRSFVTAVACFLPITLVTVRLVVRTLPAVDIWFAAKRTSDLMATADVHEHLVCLRQLLHLLHDRLRLVARHQRVVRLLGSRGESSRFGSSRLVTCARLTPSSRC